MYTYTYTLWNILIATDILYIVHTYITLSMPHVPHSSATAATDNRYFHNKLERGGWARAGLGRGDVGGQQSHGWRQLRPLDTH